MEKRLSIWEKRKWRYWHSKTGVGNLWLASQMWLFWWRHLARLIILLTRLLRLKLFL